MAFARSKRQECRFYRVWPAIASGQRTTPGGDVEPIPVLPRESGRFGAGLGAGADARGIGRADHRLNSRRMLQRKGLSWSERRRKTANFAGLVECFFHVVLGSFLPPTLVGRWRHGDTEPYFLLFLSASISPAKRVVKISFSSKTKSRRPSFGLRLRKTADGGIPPIRQALAAATASLSQLESDGGVLLLQLNSPRKPSRWCASMSSSHIAQIWSRVRVAAVFGSAITAW